MVTVERGEDELIIVMKPNRSMSWRTNKILVAAMAVWLSVLGTGFLIIGAWPIMPFLGLEVAALGGVLYYVSWKLSHQEVLLISEHQVQLEVGIRWPKKSWRWPIEKVWAVVNFEKHPEQSPNMSFQDNEGNTVRFGESLNLSDCKEVVEAMKTSGINLRRSYERVSKKF